MSELDEIEKLARIAFADGAYGPVYASKRETDMARFILAVLPVVRAAEEWTDAKCDGEADICVETELEHHPDCPVETTEADLTTAISKMREELK